MTVTTSSAPIRTKALRGKVEFDLPANGSPAPKPGRWTPKINPPPAMVLDLRKLRRLQLMIALISHLLALSTVPPDELRGGCVDRCRTGKYFPPCRR